MVFIRQAIRSILLSILAINLFSSHAFVLAQTSRNSIDGNDVNRPSSDVEPPSRRSTPPIRRAPPTQPEEEDKRVRNIREQILGDQEVKKMCPQIINNIKFELTSRDRLLIIIGKNSCAYTIMQEVLQPQLSEGKIRTYEFSGDREDVIVTLLDKRD